jgi:hypothetical protein
LSGRSQTKTDPARQDGGRREFASRLKTTILAAWQRNPLPTQDMLPACLRNQNRMNENKLPKDNAALSALTGAFLNQ